MAIDLDAMESRVEPATKLIYLCNPNNPTGALIEGEVVRDFCARLSKRAIVLVDEAYN